MFIPQFLTQKVGLLDTPVASVVYDAANATPGSALGRFPQRIDLLNTAAQHFNHKLYWACMTRHPESMPAGLETRLEEEFGSIDEFKAEWERIALAHFGSGWIWLVEHEGELKIITTNNGETPVSTVDMFPCMCMDLWEHAWYADYENRKSEYVKGWWSVVDWDVIWDNVMAAQASASCTVCS